MVLPWVTDHRSTPFRNNLLGCPYFDSKSDELIFAIDKGYSLNLIQSTFSKLRVYLNPVLSKDNYNFS